MKQFDKSIQIPVFIDRPESLRSALQQYQQHLATGRAFNKGQFDVEFVVQEENSTRRLQFQDIESEHWRKLAYLAYQQGPESWTFEDDETIADDDELYVSEAILFAIALQHDSVIGELVNTAEAMVAYARKYNDTSAMWTDDMRVYGTEALFLLGCYDSQYITFLAQFFIPYWDDEHAGGYRDYLAHFVHKHGWTRDVINAYIWCDNSGIRFQMYGNEWESDTHYQPLGEFLKANPEEYSWFKQALTERLLTSPKMLYCEDSDFDNADPVLDFYLTLLPEEGDPFNEEDQEAHRQQHFITASLEDEALDLQQQIKAQTNKPLVCYATGNFYQEEYWDNDTTGQHLRNVKPLILALPQGDTVWQHIIDDSQPAAVKALTEIPLIELAQRHAPAFYQQLSDDLLGTHNNQDIAPELGPLLYELLDEMYCDDEDAEELANIMPSSSLQQRGEQVLRLLDVFYRLLGQRELGNFLPVRLIENYELLDTHAYFSRYSQASAADQEKQINALLLNDIGATFCDMDELLCFENLEAARELFSEHPTLANPANWPRKDDGTFAIGQYAQMALLLHDAYENNAINANSKKLAAEFASPTPWQAMFDYLRESLDILGEGIFDQRGMTVQQVEQLADYFTAKQPQLTQPQVIELFEQYAHREEVVRGPLNMNQFNQQQIGYHFLSDHDENYQRCLLICFWLLKAPKDCAFKQQAKRLWQLMVALAPVRVTRLVSQAYSTNSYRVEFDDGADALEHYRLRMLGADIDRAYLQAFQVSQCRLNHYDGPEEYEEWLDKFAHIDSDDQSVFGPLKRRDAEALHHGLRYINESTKTEFYRRLLLKYPRFSELYQQELNTDLPQALLRSIQLSLNTMQWEDFNATLTDEFNTEFVELSDERLAQKPHQVSEQFRTLNNLAPLDIDWQNLWLLQDRGDHWEIIGGSEKPAKALNQIGGFVLLINSDVNGEQLMQRCFELTDRDFRSQQLVDQIMSYLQGDADYQTTLTMCKQHLHGEYLKVQAPDYRLNGLDTLIWLLDDTRRDRLTKLLLNVNYRGFKLFERNLVNHLLDQQVLQGSMSLQKRLEQDDDDDGYEEQATAQFLMWIHELDVNYEHILLYCVKHNHLQACQLWGVALTQTNELKKVAKFLRADNRATLMEMLAEHPDARPYLANFAKDKSRAVRDVVTKYLGETLS